MRRRLFLISMTLTICAFPTFAAPRAKIQKVLPHFLDQQGRHTIHPSLFERDVYQAELRQNPQRCSGMRFDVQWKAGQISGRRATLRLEVRGTKTLPHQVDRFEQTITAGQFLSKWSTLRVDGADFARLGGVRAWRITLWNGETQLAEQKSFLW